MAAAVTVSLAACGDDKPASQTTSSSASTSVSTVVAADTTVASTTSTTTPAAGFSFTFTPTSGPKNTVINMTASGCPHRPSYPDSARDIQITVRETTGNAMQNSTFIMIRDVSTDAGGNFVGTAPIRGEQGPTAAGLKQVRARCIASGATVNRDFTLTTPG
jgi:hypothetical protein